MDIEYKNNDYRFLVRVSAILYTKDLTKVVLFKIPGRDFYLLPGGRLNELEDSYTGIKREMLEELGIDIDYKLVCINENILKEKKIQNIEFVYKGILDDNNIYPQENKDQIFELINIDSIDSYDIRPSSLIDIIKSNDKLNHSINIE